MKIKTKLIFLLIAMLATALALTACSGGGDAPEDENYAVTQVVETAMAAISQTAAVQSPTPNNTPTFTPAPTETPAPTATDAPVATLQPIPTNTSVFQQPSTNVSTCDIGGFVKDVTIPDGTNMATGTKFTKTWEIKNIGTCTWNKNYQIVFYGGDQLADDTIFAFTSDDIEPGESVQVSIEMTAPDKTGNFESYWIFRNDVGQNFFVDGSSIYVQISVGITPTPTKTTAPNDPPTLQIDVPAKDITITVGTVVTFSGTATDPQDGDISSSIVWKSNIDGILGTAASLNFTLSEGTHTITASVEDSAGEEDSMTRIVVVNPVP